MSHNTFGPTDFIAASTNEALSLDQIVPQDSIETQLESARWGAYGPVFGEPENDLLALSALLTISYFYPQKTRETKEISVAQDQDFWTDPVFIEAFVQGLETGTTPELPPAVTPEAPGELAPITARTDTVSLDQATSVFFTQFANPKWNRNGKPFSEDCGPASLAMAEKLFGKPPPDLAAGETDPEKWIDQTRLAMTGNLNNVGTSSKQVMAGAEKAGLKGEYVHSMDEIDQALASGKPIVLAGNPGGYVDALGFTAKDYATNGKGSLFRGPHWILVLPGTEGQIIVNDPACRNGPIILNRELLHAYFSGKGGGVGIALSA